MANKEPYDIKTAPRELLEEDLTVVRTHILPRMEQLQAENAGLTGHVTPPSTGSGAAAAGYDLKAAPKELLEEDLQLVRQQVLPQLEQLQQENAALKAQQQQQGSGQQ
jgi:hypothetical protein